jgi:hypothetical protein
MIFVTLTIQPVSTLTPPRRCQRLNASEINMSPKQAIYRDILFWTLPHLRNVASQRWWRRVRDQSAYYEAELVHNLPISMYEPEFTDHDIWFLNAQANFYIRNCSASISPLYPEQSRRLLELRTLVPDLLKSKLKLNGNGA